MRVECLLVLGEMEASFALRPSLRRRLRPLLLKAPLESCRFCGSSCVLVTEWVSSGCPSNRQSLV